jgi:hypothetical protein
MRVTLKQVRQELAHAEFVIDYEKICHESKKSFSIFHLTFFICHSRLPLASRSSSFHVLSSLGS